MRPEPSQAWFRSKPVPMSCPSFTGTVACWLDRPFDSGFRTMGLGFPRIVRIGSSNPFYTTRPSGTGLGLAIVHKFILAHQGDVRLLSDGEEELSGGAILKFDCRFPAERNPDGSDSCSG